MSIRWHLLACIATTAAIIPVAAYAQQPLPPLPTTTPPPSPAPGPTTIIVVPGTPSPAYSTSPAPGYGPPATPGYESPAYGQPDYQSPAYGQPAYGAPPPYAKGYAPPLPYVPPPRPEQGVHLHDGFYLRMALGPASMRSTFSPNKGLSEVVISGTGAAVEFGIGGAVSDGFILGGKISSIAVIDPDAKTDGKTAQIDGSLGLASLQFFTDIYPMPEEGLHFQAGVGPASLSYTPSGSSRVSSEDSQTTSGVAGSLGVGWEGWVSKQWGLGALFNLNFARFKDNSEITLDGTPNSAVQSSISVIAPSLMFTATLN